MARYELVTTVYDNLEKKELAQITVEESDDLADIVEEFEEATGDDFAECSLDGADGDDEDDEDEERPARSA